MSPPSRIATLLQTAERPLVVQDGVTDAHLVRENKALSAEVARLKRELRELERVADTDPLLDIYNRRAFMREIARAQTVMDRYDFVSSIIYLDLDGFKAINDRHGHATGDQVLAAVAKTLRSGVRDCDMVARLGGDEFGVLLFKSTPEIAKAKAAALACRIGQLRVTHPDGIVGVSVSWGTAPCEPGDTPDQVLDRADRAMYLDKRI